MKPQWEKCLRNTKCVDCSKIMERGNHRLKSIEDVKYGWRTYPHIQYRCQPCGTKWLERSRNQIYVVPKLPTELRPKRYLRPMTKKEDL